MELVSRSKECQFERKGRSMVGARSGFEGSCVSEADWNRTDRESPEVFHVVVSAEWGDVKEQVPVSLRAC